KCEFAMEAARVRAILPSGDLTPADSPERAQSAWLAGFASLRGREFPVIDLAGKLGLPQKPRGRRPCIVAVETSASGLAGFVADGVSEIVTARERDYHHGRLRTGGRPRRVLNPDCILAAE